MFQTQRTLSPTDLKADIANVVTLLTALQAGLAKLPTPSGVNDAITTVINELNTVSQSDIAMNAIAAIITWAQQKI